MDTSLSYWFRYYQRKVEGDGRWWWWWWRLMDVHTFLFYMRSTLTCWIYPVMVKYLCVLAKKIRNPFTGVECNITYCTNLNWRRIHCTSRDIKYNDYTDSGLPCLLSQCA